MSRQDDGFILLDALLAVALLALAGTVVVTISMSGLDRQRDELDRSVALVTMQSMVRQFLLVAPKDRNRLEQDDELFTYAIDAGGTPLASTTRVAEWSIVATPKAGGAPIEMDFLAPLAP